MAFTKNLASLPKPHLAKELLVKVAVLLYVPSKENSKVNLLLGLLTVRPPVSYFNRLEETPLVLLFLRIAAAVAVYNRSRNPAIHHLVQYIEPVTALYTLPSFCCWANSFCLIVLDESKATLIKGGGDSFTVLARTELRLW